MGLTHHNWHILSLSVWGGGGCGICSCGYVHTCVQVPWFWSPETELGVPLALHATFLFSHVSVVYAHPSSGAASDAGSRGTRSTLVLWVGVSRIPQCTGITYLHEASPGFYIGAKHHTQGPLMARRVLCILNHRLPFVFETGPLIASEAPWGWLAHTL